jgi:tetratricopeptide (TPR) repeat protein
MKRTKQHVLETESRRALESLLPPEWIFRVKTPDYGIDIEIEIVEGEEVTNKVLWVQLKATQDVKRKGSYQMRTDHLQYYEGCPLPVVILYWIKPENTFYSVFAQKYIDEILSKNNPDWRRQKTVTVTFDSNPATAEDLRSTATEGYQYVINQQLHLEKKITTILSPVSRLCIGRDTELSHLEEDLKHKYIHLIKGIAGIGKTTLGLKFRDRLKEKGYQTFWHQCDSQSYEGFLLTLSEYLKSRGSVSAIHLENQKIIPEERLKIAVQELCTYPTILFCDNFHVFEDDSDFRIFTDYLRNSHLVIMSRSQPKFLSEDYKSLQYLERDSSIEFLKTLGVKEPQEVLEKIYDRTKGHPWSLVCFSRLSRILPVRTLLEELPDFSKERQTYISEQCWKHLGDSERDFLMRGSVFIQPLNFDALRVCSKAGLTDVLICLAESFYIMKRGDYYYIHDIIKDFAFLKLKENHKLYVEAQRRAAEYYQRSLSAGNLLLIYYHLKEAGDRRGAVDSIMENIAYFWREGYWSDVRDVLEKSLDFFEEEEKRADIYRHLGTIVHRLSEWDKAIGYYEKSLEISEKIGYIHGIATTYGALGLVYADKGEWDIAIDYYEKSLKIKEEIGYIHGIAAVYGNLGLVYADKGEWDIAIDYYEKSLKISEKTGNIHGIAAVYGEMGLVYAAIGEWNKAIDCYQNNLKISEKTGNIHGIAITYCALGLVHAAKGEWDIAIDYYEKSLEISEKIEYIPGIAAVYGNLGSVHAAKGEWDKAIDYYEKSLEISERIGDVHQIAITWENLAQAYCGKDDIDTALQYCENSFEILEKIGDRLNLAKTHRTYGIIFRKSKELTKSKRELEKTIEICQELSAMYELAEAFFELAMTLLEIGDMKTAREYFKKALEIFRKLKVNHKIKKVEEQLKSR